MKINRQAVNLGVIIVGGGLLLYDLVSASNNVYIKIAGLILLMYGLYTATQSWVAENQENENEQQEKQDE